MIVPAEEPILILKPQGVLGTGETAELLARIRLSDTDLEFDFSEVELLDFSFLQLLLVVVKSWRRRGKTVIVKDSESEVLRSALTIAGVRPELGGLSAGLVL